MGGRRRRNNTQIAAIWEGTGRLIEGAGLQVRSSRLKKIVDFCLRLGMEFEDGGKMGGDVSLG